MKTSTIVNNAVTSLTIFGVLLTTLPAMVNDMTQDMTARRGKRFRDGLPQDYQPAMRDAVRYADV